MRAFGKMANPSSHWSRGARGSTRSISAVPAPSSKPSSNPRWRNWLRRFLASLGYTGVAEVEFKYDARERQYKLLDVNGRFWTWCGLGALAGADFPYLAFRQSLGDEIASCRARSGVAWMHGSRDVLAAWQELAGGTLRLRDYLRSFGMPLTFANFAADDPMPALGELPAAIMHRAGASLRRKTRKGPSGPLRRRLAK